MKEFYLDPAVTSMGRLPARWRRTGVESVSLNGEWKFKLFPAPEETGAFYLPEADESGFAPRPIEDCLHHKGSGGFSVGTGDADHLAAEFKAV